MIKYLKLPFQFDAVKMQQEVRLLNSGAWLQHYQVLHYEGDWSAIPLRSPAGKADNIIIAASGDIPYENTVFLDSCPYIETVLGNFKCPLLAVRLLKLSAGAVIKEHRDADLCFEKGEIRLHIPVITHDDVEFYLEKEQLHPGEGQCWYMNFNLLHSIRNNSNINRIHLVIDAVVNDWVRDQFATAAFKKEIADTPQYSPEVQLQIIAQLRLMNTAVSQAMADEMERETGRQNEE